jgi:hypothetical protein
MKRENGFYWVKYYGSWIVAQFINRIDGWLLMGNNETLKDLHFQEINEKQIVNKIKKK